MADKEKKILTDEPTPYSESFEVKLKLLSSEGNESTLSFPSTSAKATSVNIQALVDSIIDPEQGVIFLADNNGDPFTDFVEAYTVLTQRWHIEVGGE